MREKMKSKRKLALASIVLGMLLGVGAVWWMDRQVYDYSTYEFTVESKLGKNRYLVSIERVEYYFNFDAVKEMKFVHPIELEEGQTYTMILGETVWGNYKMFKEIN